MVPITLRTWTIITRMGVDVRHTEKAVLRAAGRYADIVEALLVATHTIYMTSSFPRSPSCSCSRRGGAVDADRPGDEGERGGGLGRPGETEGSGRLTGDGLIVMAVPPWDSPARAGKGRR
jgi:hypothetical protein